MAFVIVTENHLYYPSLVILVLGDKTHTKYIHYFPRAQTVYKLKIHI